MTDIVDKPVRAGELPTHLRGDFDVNSLVLLTVRAVTENGFTLAFEQGVLEAEAEAETLPYRPAQEVLDELRAIVANEP